MTEQPKQPKLNYGRFVLVMLVVTWAVRQLVGETWLAVAVALAVNVLISWPRRPKGGGETGEARPEGEVRAWSDPKPELEPKPGREIRSLADLKAARYDLRRRARKAWRRGREEGRREREARSEQLWEGD
jgi:hypothetical protein